MSSAEQRAMYQPAGHPTGGSQAYGEEGAGGGGTIFYASGRPASASRARQELRPRSAGAQERATIEAADDGWLADARAGSRARPTSAPAIRASAPQRGKEGGDGHHSGQQAGRALKGLPEEGDYSFGTGADQFGIIDVDNYVMHVIGNIKGGKKIKPRRPTSAPASKQQKLQASSAVPRGRRPTSAHPRSGSRDRGTTMRDALMLPESGGMRFLRPHSASKPVLRIFSPIDSPLLHEAQFVPTWAQLSSNLPENHPARGGAWQPHSSTALLAREGSHASMRSSTEGGGGGSRPGSASGMRPGSAQSRTHSRPGSAHGRSPSPGGRPRSAKDSIVPLGVPRNPLATKTGTSMIKEVEGCFEPLQSQSRIPHYDSLHDPNLKQYWNRRGADVSKLMRKMGHAREEWAPDSGLFEASIGDELRRLYIPGSRAEPSGDEGPIAFPVPAHEDRLGALGGNVVSIEVSEEAVVGRGHSVPILLSQPVLSCWLHWGKLPSARETPDLDLSAVMFDANARVTETVFYRKLTSRHDAIVHTGDDTDVEPGGESEAVHDLAAGTRKMEGIVVELPRIPVGCHAIAIAVTCYTDETSLAEASGAELRVCVGRGGGVGLNEDIVRYYLTSERYNAAAPCILVRDSASESGWKLQTTAKVALGNVVLEAVPALQAMLRQSGVCMPYSVEIEYCRAQRPTPSLRGRSSDFSDSFLAVAGACARAFPGVSVVGNPRGAWEQPRVGAFEVTLVDAAANVRFPLWSKLELKKWPRRMETITGRMHKAMQARLPFEIPEDRSEVRVVLLDAVTRGGLPWSIVEVHALGLAAQKLTLASAKQGLVVDPGGAERKRKKQTMVGDGAGLGEKKTYRVQADVDGVLNMRLPGGRYEVYGLADGYVCEYPLEITVRPFSKNRVIAKVALVPKGAAGEMAPAR